MDIKLVVEGENMERDWIFPKALKGKKRNLNTQRISRIKSSAMGLLLVRKLCDLIADTSRHTSAATDNR
jgi:hypothetical protein